MKKREIDGWAIFSGDCNILDWTFTTFGERSAINKFEAGRSWDSWENAKKRGCSVVKLRVTVEAREVMDE